MATGKIIHKIVPTELRYVGMKTICGKSADRLHWTRSSSDWKDVTCKNCLKKKPNLEKRLAMLTVSQRIGIVGIILVIGYIIYLAIHPLFVPPSFNPANDVCTLNCSGLKHQLIEGEIDNKDGQAIDRWVKNCVSYNETFNYNPLASKCLEWHPKPKPISIDLTKEKCIEHTNDGVVCESALELNDTYVLDIHCCIKKEPKTECEKGNPNYIMRCVESYPPCNNYTSEDWIVKDDYIIKENKTACWANLTAPEVCIEYACKKKTFCDRCVDDWGYTERVCNLKGSHGFCLNWKTETCDDKCVCDNWKYHNNKYFYQVGNVNVVVEIPRGCTMPDNPIFNCSINDSFATCEFSNENPIQCGFKGSGALLYGEQSRCLSAHGKGGE